MSHDKVCGICQPNKCMVEVDTKENTDAVAAKVSTLESNVSTLSSSVGGFDSRISAVESGMNGRVNVSTYATSGDITLGVLSFSNSSIASTAFLTSNSCTCGTGSFTKKNTSLINYTGSTPVVNGTATITVTLINNYSSTNVKVAGYFYVTVKNNTTGATILSNKSINTGGVAGYGASVSTSTTFTRVSNNTYTVTVRGYQIQNATTGSDYTSNYSDVCQYSVSVTTSGGVTVYVA